MKVNDLFVLFFIAVLVAAFATAFTVIGWHRGRDEARRSAVEAGAAEWATNSEGVAVFHWKGKNQ